MELSREILLEAYTKMVRIRVFEDRVDKEFATGELPGFVHMYAGEEAIAVGVCIHLHDGDYIASTHRGHGHCIAKGVSVKGMMAELYGRATGVCKGKGGSMHIADMEKGMLGANGIVGAGIPLATGAALTAKTKKTGSVAVTFFGDGGANQGAFHECLNLASIWKLPVLFVAESNGYAESTPQEWSKNVPDIATRASAYGVPGLLLDGNDFFAVSEAAREAIDRARKGRGPTLIDCQTYRYYGHFSGDDPKRYRTDEEVAEWKKRDPIPRFRQAVLAKNLLTHEEMDAIDSSALKELDEAVDFAKQSRWPDPEETLDDVYVTYPRIGR